MTPELCLQRRVSIGQSMVVGRVKRKKQKLRDKKPHCMCGESLSGCVAKFKFQAQNEAEGSAGRNPLCHFKECRLYPKEDRKSLVGFKQQGTCQIFLMGGEDGFKEDKTGSQENRQANQEMMRA